MTFEVGKQNLVSISTQRPIPTTSPLVVDYSPLKQPDTIKLGMGEHLLVLPMGWSEEDVTVRAIGCEYSAKEFENTTGGATVGNAAQLFGQNARFDISTSMTAEREYIVGVQAVNGRPAPIIIVLWGPNKTELGRYEFDRGDNSLTWQEKKVTPKVDLTRLSIVFVNDYTGPDGDRNATVYRVRVVEAPPGDGEK
jgi:hypothetical protein